MINLVSCLVKLDGFPIAAIFIPSNFTQDQVEGFALTDSDVARELDGLHVYKSVVDSTRNINFQTTPE